MFKKEEEKPPYKLPFVWTIVFYDDSKREVPVLRRRGPGSDLCRFTWNRVGVEEGRRE